MVRRLEQYRERGRALGFLIFLAVALAVSFPYFEGVRNANERPRLMQGMALWDTGVWAIDGPGGRRLDPGPDVSRSRIDHRLYPNKPPGVSVVCALAYASARAVHGDELTLRHLTWWARIWTGWLPTMLLCWFLVRRCSRLYSRTPAIAAVAVYALGSPAASYAHLAYGHQLAAALLVVGVSLCIDATSYELGNGLGTERPPMPRAVLWRALVGGLAAGCAVTVEYGAVFAGLPLAVLLLWRARESVRRVATVLALAGALVPIGLLAAYHSAVFGSPLSTGYHHVTNLEFAAKHAQGFLGLGLPSWQAFHTNFLAADSGLIWWMPLFPLAVYGLIKASTHIDKPCAREARMFAVTFLMYAVIVSSLSFTGGWRIGPRYLVVVLPMLVPGLAEVLGQMRARALFVAPILALALYGLVVNTMAANLWPHVDVTNINHPVGEVLIPLWSHGVEPYGLLEAWFNINAVHAIIAVTVLGALVALVRVVEIKPTTLVAVAVGVGCGAGLLGLAQLWPVHVKGTRNLAYIVRVWEPKLERRSGAHGIRIRPLPSGVVDLGPAKKHRLVPPR